MRRHTKGNVLDISIRGDELEQHRIQLEHNLQHTDLSFRLSSATDEGENDYNQTNNSIEYPRHNSGPADFPDFASFDQRSRDHFDGDVQSQLHGWSYRTVDDDEGINPYGGETLSTAAHHASALTLSAGLGGGRGVRRDVSLSGAEYDPDRPLHAMISGVDSKLSVFDIEPSRSKYPGVGSLTFDPLVVDSTAELDRVLQSGHAPPPHMQPQNRSVRLRSPHPSSSSASSSTSDSDHHSEGHRQDPQSRPKLSDALRRVSFSPKRPRSPRPNSSHNTTTQTHPVSPLVRMSSLPPSNTNDATPRPNPRVASTRRTNIFPSYNSSTAQPEVRLQPPTPSTTGSKFTRMARGLVRELETEQNQRHAQDAEASRPASNDYDRSRVQERNPFDDAGRHHPDVSIAPSPARRPTPRKTSMKAGSQSLHQVTPKGKVHLPDVTGLTSAVESPAKMGMEYYVYRAEEATRESEARLLTTLNTVQSKLHHLEEENSISRRRVRELELELEVCKREVARERTRIMEREDVIVQHQRDGNRRGTAKGKARARDVSVSMGEEMVGDRYKEAVEEKKALEALITTLRTHLTRLTSELSSHKELLTELRSMRESDVKALKEKSVEVERLKEEVERLAGEVEVLRGVVEEGLKERRAVRESSHGEVEVEVRHSSADLAMSHDLSDGEDEEGEEEPLQERDRTVGNESRREVHHSENDDDEEEEEDDEVEPFDPLSILGSSRANVGHADRTMRTDHATLGSSDLASSAPANITSNRFINTEDLERVSADIEDRRSDRSGSGSESRLSHSLSRSRMQSRTPSPTPTTASRRRVTVEDVTASEREESRRNAASPSIVNTSRAPRPHQTTRPSAPTPAQASRNQSRRTKQDAAPGPSVMETPFPQIRGAHLERLFFSAPEHNAKTCTVCHRRRRPSPTSPSWLPSRFRHNAADISENEDDDEGFAEGSEAGHHEHAPRDKGKQRSQGVPFSREPEQWRKTASKEGLPPQTVVARVIRELEDDFTHYKSIYVELADQYKDMDAASNVPKRNILAQHLREVVDILEQKGDQIASLYDLLAFKDKPVSESVLASKTRPAPVATASWGRSTGSKRHPTFA